MVVVVLRCSDESPAAGLPRQPELVSCGGYGSAASRVLPHLPHQTPLTLQSRVNLAASGSSSKPAALGGDEGGRDWAARSDHMDTFIKNGFAFREGPDGRLRLSSVPFSQQARSPPFPLSPL